MVRPPGKGWADLFPSFGTKALLFGRDLRTGLSGKVSLMDEKDRQSAPPSVGSAGVSEGNEGSLGNRFPSEDVPSSATIRDVAELAGVSVASVSRYLNKKGYVGQETAARI